VTPPPAPPRCARIRRVRDALAAVIVAAPFDPAARATLDDLAAVLARRPLAAAARARLAALPALVRLAPDAKRVELPAALEPERAALAARVLCARRLLDGGAGAAPDAAGGDALGAGLDWAGRLFAAGLFFEVHEVLEPLWRERAGTERRALQGIIQLAVAFHHLLHGNPASAATLFGAARTKLAAGPAPPGGVDVPALLAATGPWEARARAGEGWTDALALPRLRGSGGDPPPGR
jgi:hypothetical protein